MTLPRKDLVVASNDLTANLKVFATALKTHLSMYNVSDIDLHINIKGTLDNGFHLTVTCDSFFQTYVSVISDSCHHAVAEYIRRCQESKNHPPFLLVEGTRPDPIEDEDHYF